MAFMLSSRSSERFEIPLSTIEQNSYMVKWQAVAGDAKKLKGELGFSFKQLNSSESNHAVHESGHNKAQNRLFLNENSAPGKVVSEFHHALKTGDKILARSLLSDNVLIYEGGGVERSADEYANHHMLSDMKYLKNITSKVLEHIVTISGKMAVSSSRSHSTGEFRGKVINSSGIETMVLEEVNGNWKIIRIHWS